jgi:hypothetical protein
MANPFAVSIFLPTSKLFLTFSNHFFGARIGAVASDAGAPSRQDNTSSKMAGAYSVLTLLGTK